ncbi:MAG: regulatory protein [Marinoscillum sp.]|jgi:regulatory protein
MSRATLLKQAKVKAGKFCSGRERSPFEVSRKLQNWELTDDEISEILGELIEERFIDEDRFCKAFCHDKFEFNKWGRHRINLELLQHKIPQDTIKSGLDELDVKRYKEVLDSLVAAKWNSLKGDQWLKKQKTMAFLISKGFEMDLTIESMRQMSARER